MEAAGGGAPSHRFRQGAKAKACEAERKACESTTTIRSAYYAVREEFTPVCLHGTGYNRRVRCRLCKRSMLITCRKPSPPFAELADLSWDLKVREPRPPDSLLWAYLMARYCGSGVGAGSGFGTGSA
jgi:hypothetical protein